MLSVIVAQNRNSPAQVVQKCAIRLIDGTQCFHCDRLESVMSLQCSILGFLARIIIIIIIIIIINQTHSGDWFLQQLQF